MYLFGIPFTGVGNLRECVHYIETVMTMSKICGHNGPSIVEL